MGVVPPGLKNPGGQNYIFLGEQIYTDRNIIFFIFFYGGASHITGGGCGGLIFFKRSGLFFIFYFFYGGGRTSLGEGGVGKIKK